MIVYIYIFPTNIDIFSTFISQSESTCNTLSSLATEKGVIPHFQVTTAIRW